MVKATGISEMKLIREILMLIDAYLWAVIVFNQFWYIWKTIYEKRRNKIL